MDERTTVSCEEVLAQLWEYVDGELTPERRNRIEAHLEVCERCYPQYDFRRAFRRFVERQARTPAPPGLRRRVFARLLEEEAASG